MRIFHLFSLLVIRSLNVITFEATASRGYVSSAWKRVPGHRSTGFQKAARSTGTGSPYLPVSFLLIIISYLFASPILLAQQVNCVETLNRARQNFADGHLYGIPAVLKPCIDNGFNKNQKIQAYWLLTRTYLIIDDPISAEDSYLKLLKLDPEYKVDQEKDPIEMVYLSEKFTTTPIFVLFVKAGFNFTWASVIHNYGVDNTNLSNEAYRGEAGFQLGGGAEWNITDHLSLGLEVNLANRRYGYSNNLFEVDDLDFLETQTSVNIPLFLKYRVTYDKFQPFLYIGQTQHVLVSASAEVSLTDRATSGEENLTEFPVTGPREDLDDLRDLFTRSLIGGIGFNYRVGYNYLVMDIRYQLGMENIIDINNQFSDPDLLYRYGFVDDDKKLNTLAVSVGFVKPLYKPRKIKRRKKNFFKRIF